MALQPEKEDAVCLCEDAEPMAREHDSCISRDLIPEELDDDEDDEEEEDDDDDEEDEEEDRTDHDEVANASTILSRLSQFKMTVEDGLKYPEHSGPAASLQSCLSSRPCTVCVYLFLVLILLCSFISLLVISFLVAAPYAKAARFLRTHCTCVDVQYGRTEEQCSCGKGCTSHYPCIRIKVNISTGHHTSVIATLANDETDLHKECTYYPHCHSSRAQNEDAVFQYELQYGRFQHRFLCYFNPDNQKEVIRTHRFKVTQVIHGILWTSLLFIVSLTLLLMMFRRRGFELV